MKVTTATHQAYKYSRCMTGKSYDKYGFYFLHRNSSYFIYSI